MGTGESELQSDLIDLTDVSLERIALLPDSVLAESLRRILAEGSDATEGDATEGYATEGYATEGDATEGYASFENRI